MRNQMADMYLAKNGDKGFTLIELLIVIAIIGVLAATVIVSLGSQTDKAQQGSVKIGVSSIRNLATVAVVEGGVGTNGVCDDIYDQVSGEKSDWTWTDSVTCHADGLDEGTAVTGEICCSSKGDKWAVWGLLDGNGAAGGNVYCADSSGFAGKFALSSGNGENRTNSTVQTGKSKGVGNSNRVVVESCKQP